MPVFSGSRLSFLGLFLGLFRVASDERLLAIRNSCCEHAVAGIVQATELGFDDLQSLHTQRRFEILLGTPDFKVLFEQQD